MWELNMLNTKLFYKEKSCVPWLQVARVVSNILNKVWLTFYDSCSEFHFQSSYPDSSMQNNKIRVASI